MNEGIDARLALVQALREKQAQLTLEQFGATFKTGKAWLSLFYRGKVGFGGNTLSKLRAAYPDLASLIDAYIAMRGRASLKEESHV